MNQILVVFIAHLTFPPELFLFSFSLPGSSGMILGGGIDADADWIYVSSHGTGSVYKMGRLNPNIMVQLVPNNYFKYPQDIVLVAPDTLLVNDLYGHAVYVISVFDAIPMYL